MQWDYLVKDFGQLTKLGGNMAKEIVKKWYQSKTKIGTLLIAIGPVLATIGGLLTGSIDMMTGISALTVELGAVTAILGIRDLPFINRK